MTLGLPVAAAAVGATAVAVDGDLVTVVASTAGAAAARDVEKQGMRGRQRKGHPVN